MCSFFLIMLRPPEHILSQYSRDISTLTHTRSYLSRATRLVFVGEEREKQKDRKRERESKCLWLQ